jgi:hypothetical protein
VASERFEGVLTHGEDAWLVEPNPKSAAEGIVKLLKNSALRKSLVKRGTDRTRTMDWAWSARQIEEVLLRNAPEQTPRAAGKDTWVAPNTNVGQPDIPERVGPSQAPDDVTPR